MCVEKETCFKSKDAKMSVNVNEVVDCVYSNEG